MLCNENIVIVIIYSCELGAELMIRLKVIAFQFPYSTRAPPDASPVFDMRHV